jgi:hypothetical protein
MEQDYVNEMGDPDGYRFFDHNRFLAGEKADEPTRIDYSVLSVAVMTLGLVMMVEVFRHRLDHAAMGRPFFTAVLEGVYAECKYPPLLGTLTFLLRGVVWSCSLTHSLIAHLLGIILFIQWRRLVSSNT